MSNFSNAKQLLLVTATGLALSFAAGAPAHAQLESALSAAKASTAASAASQQRVETLDDEADRMIREYRAVLQQKDNIALFVDQQGIYLESQKGEIESLNQQLVNIEAIKKGISPMMLKMAVALEDMVKSDMPFLMAERLERVERIKQALADPDVTPADQYRLLLNAYEIESNYGLQLSSYEGTHPTKPGNVVNFLRYGRVALVYMAKDGSEVAYYNKDTGNWEPLSGGKANDMRQAIRVAKEQAAPEIVLAPVAVK